ncbi:MAG: diguanylate cyclase [Acidobacteria bacterium]|nr:diguanylate cyclase [Acidobacteriota bacterium]
MRNSEHFRFLPLGSRVLAVVSWTQWLIATVLFLISVVAVHLGSDPGMNWNRESGVIWNLVPDGPAERSGIREGDRLAAVDGFATTSGRPPFYSVSPSSEARLLVERESRRIHFDLYPVTQWELRRLGFAAGGSLFLQSLNEYLRIAVNLWVLMLSAVILLLRPGLPQARIASVALAYWVGGNTLLDVPGFGALTSGWPMTLQFVTHFVDHAFYIGFFPLLVHYALLFPRPLPVLNRRREIQAFPYLIALPVLILATIRISRVVEPALSRVFPAIQITSLMPLYTSGMMMLSLVILSLHFRHEPLEHDRRRLQWALSSLLPPFVTWMLLLILDAMRAPATIMAAGRTLLWLGVASGTMIFAWAIVRHRLFETRLLLRKSIQYALARGTLLALIAIAATSLTTFLWINRHRSIAELVSSDFVALILILGPLATLLHYRKTILSWIDRRFFREKYDAQQSLVQLISVIQKGSDLNVLVRLTIGEIEKALHPTHISFWKLDPSGSAYQSVVATGDGAATPPLSRHSSVVSMMIRQNEPVQIDLLYPAQLLRRHSSSDRFWIWLSVTRAALLIPMIVENELSGFLLLGERRSEEPYSARDRELLMTVSRQLSITDAYSRLEEMARQDPLTAALNRHAYYSLIEKRGKQGDLDAGCVAIVDLDDLKTINDTLGHAAGDLAIRQVASAIRSVLRADDLVFRWGGDEFLVILFGISEDLGRERLTGINQHLAEGQLSSAMPISVSIGISPFTSASELALAIERADLEMYSFKHGRRG